tara:strand:- start:229 stop:816 length:588 start_codon:yes stop_codon:yes gene_type:complete
MKTSFLIALLAGLSLSSVAHAQASNWRTYYEQPISTFETNKWQVEQINVAVTGSNKVVWNGRGTGNAVTKVKSLFTGATKLGTRKLQGKRAVSVTILVLDFQSPTKQVRRLDRTDLGVHHINFSIEINDLKSGTVLLPPTVIEADLEALTGSFARAFVAQKQGQKERVTQHLASVIQGFLGQGPDPRRTFKRYVK